MPLYVGLTPSDNETAYSWLSSTEITVVLRNQKNKRQPSATTTNLPFASFVALAFVGGGLLLTPEGHHLKVRVFVPTEHRSSEGMLKTVTFTGANESFEVNISEALKE